MSKLGHVKSWLNMGGPSSKSKYEYNTDSEGVLWRKGETSNGSFEKTLKFMAHDHLELS